MWIAKRASFQYERPRMSCLLREDITLAAFTRRTAKTYAQLAPGITASLSVLPVNKPPDFIVRDVRQHGRRRLHTVRRVLAFQRDKEACIDRSLFFSVANSVSPQDSSSEYEALAFHENPRYEFVDIFRAMRSVWSNAKLYSFFQQRKIANTYKSINLKTSGTAGSNPTVARRFDAEERLPAQPAISRNCGRHWSPPPQVLARSHGAATVDSRQPSRLIPAASQQDEAH